MYSSWEAEINTCEKYKIVYGNISLQLSVDKF